MPILDPREVGALEKPELFFGVVGAVGAPVKYVGNLIKTKMEERGYRHKEINLSDFLLEAPDLSSPKPPPKATEHERINSLMDLGNELRKKTGGGETLALIGVAEIHNRRERNTDAPENLTGKSFLFKQLKHPDEVFWLRRIYETAFHLIGVYSPEGERKENLIRTFAMNENEAEKLIKRDAGEKEPFGQQLRDTFCLADYFVNGSNSKEKENEGIEKQLDKYFNLLFSEKIITPTVDEYGMFLASSAAIRSSDLSRQVGAAIINPTREVISLGANEVPAAGGGQYWEDIEEKHRDIEAGFDPNFKRKKEILDQVLRVIKSNFSLEKSEKAKILKNLEENLKKTDIFELTEFARAVHAEMEAILSAGRIGVSVKNCWLYTTTYPCHNCTKHIINSGIKRVVYIEPYPKSLATELHQDSISNCEEEIGDKVKFEPFIGVSPRMHEVLFSTKTFEGKREKRKDSEGQVKTDLTHMRFNVPVLNYFERESIASFAIKELFEKGEENCERED